MTTSCTNCWKEDYFLYQLLKWSLLPVPIPEMEGYFLSQWLKWRTTFCTNSWNVGLLHLQHLTWRATSLPIDEMKDYILYQRLKWRTTSWINDWNEELLPIPVPMNFCNTLVLIASLISIPTLSLCCPPPVLSPYAEQLLLIYYLKLILSKTFTLWLPLLVLMKIHCKFDIIIKKKWQWQHSFNSRI